MVWLLRLAPAVFAAICLLFSTNVEARHRPLRGDLEHIYQDAAVTAPVTAIKPLLQDIQVLEQGLESFLSDLDSRIEQIESALGITPSQSRLPGSSEVLPSITSRPPKLPPITLSPPPTFSGLTETSDPNKTDDTSTSHSRHPPVIDPFPTKSSSLPESRSAPLSIPIVSVSLPLHVVSSSQGTEPVHPTTLSSPLLCHASGVVAPCSSAPSTTEESREIEGTATVTKKSTSTITLTVTLTEASNFASKSSLSLPLSKLASSRATSTANKAASTSGSYKSPSSTGYHFDPLASNNVAVYYGVTPDTTADGLLSQCENPDIDIVILAFVSTFFGPRNYPIASFGPACIGQTSEQQKWAPGLQNCTMLGRQITQCQAIGKKILVSLGGYIASSAFESEDESKQFAATMWSLFGAGTEENLGLRPFGSAIVDGFDIDNENHNTTYYDAFAAQLRRYYSSDPSKSYYISAAPQCPRPDESIPEGAMRHADFVWVQFYNNPECNLDSTGFLGSFQDWSKDLALVKSTPRLFIGGGAWSGAGSGYVAGDKLKSIIAGARALKVPNLGGIMLWDGSEGLQNLDGSGKNYLQLAKAAVS